MAWRRWRLVPVLATIQALKGLEFPPLLSQSRLSRILIQRVGALGRGTEYAGQGQRRAKLRKHRVVSTHVRPPMDYCLYEPREV